MNYFTTAPTAQAGGGCVTRDLLRAHATILDDGPVVFRFEILSRQEGAANKRTRKAQMKGASAYSRRNRGPR